VESAKNVTFGKPILHYSSPLNVLDIGGKDGKRCRESYPSDNITVVDLVNGWDIMRKGLPDGDWDILFANHIIEHVSSPDFFLQECRRVMSRKTVLEIGTPNLTAWFNRILFLFGYVPHSVELSRFFNVGKPFNWGSEQLGGHVYVYSVPAILDLLKHYGFKLISVVGESSTFPCNKIISYSDKILTKLNHNLASAVRIKCMLS